MGDLAKELGEVAAALEKAKLGSLEVYDANEGDGWPPCPLWCLKNEDYDSEDECATPVQACVNYGGKEDAEAMALAINFLRNHHAALTAALVDAERWQHARWHALTELLVAYPTTDTSDVGLDYAVDRAIAAARQSGAGREG